jgi:murein DD-endopeptidase MepM/ murein hydrolase activator NlpD
MAAVLVVLAGASSVAVAIARAASAAASESPGSATEVRGSHGPGMVASEDAAPPYGLPFAGPHGPSTWYVSQAYGNTVYAFFERSGLYRNGQGVHFGLDIAAPCGTPVLAIGDGVVRSVDGPGGSPPHNLAVDHPDGRVSFYGHLLARPPVNVGQPVLRGEAIAQSGDMFGTCYSSPHLHLEIRDRSMSRLENPIPLIDADWNRIVQLGASSPTFERDLTDPDRWQTYADQPGVTLGGGLLNDYARPWPSDGW